MFDEPVPAFGRFRVTASLGDGRFGTVYLGVDPDTDQIVVVRTFSDPLTEEQQARMLAALQRLCDSPLDHASIATPLASGIEQGVPYLVHTYLPGISVDEHLRTHGPRPLADVVLRVTHLAAAIDFAAAVGVHHGALSPRDIIFAPQSTGVAGFGMVQALRDAGLDMPAPTRAEDIYALAAMTFELLIGYRFSGGSIRAATAPLRGVAGVDHEALVRALEPALSSSPERWPDTALAFAAALQAALLDARGAAEPSRIATRDVGRLSFGAGEGDPARTEAGSDAGFAPQEAVPAADVDAPSRSDEGTDGGDDVMALDTRDVEADAAAAAGVDDMDAEPFTFDAPLDAGLDPSLYGEPHRQGLELEAPLHDEPALQAGPAWDEEPTAPPPGEPAFALPAGPAAAALPGTARDPDRARQEPRRSIPAVRPVATSFAAEQAPASGGSGWRVVAIAAVLALLLIVTGAWWILRRDEGAGVTTASTDAPVTGVTEPTVTRPDGGAPPGPAPDDGAPLASGGASPPDPNDGSAPVVSEPLPAVPPTAVPPPRPSSAPPRRPDPPQAAAPAPSPARERAAAPVAQSPAAESGRVLVRSTPARARVLVDGSYRGETPVAVRDLPLGTHTIVITAPGFAPWEGTVTLTTDRPAQQFDIALDAQ